MPKSEPTHFWFMAVQMPTATGYRINDYQGALTPQPGTTRLSLFMEIRAEVARQDPDTQGGVVISFDVQPNKL